MTEEQPPAWPVYSKKTEERVQSLVASGQVFDYAGQGAVVELESALRSRFATDYALTLNSGTSAIFATLAAIGVGHGDEVVVAGWTFLAAVTPLLWLGATPVLADVAAGQPVADAASIAAVLTDRTRAVIVTHLFGEPVDTKAIRDILAGKGVVLIEDCSHAHASDVGGYPPGHFSDAAILSLGARKIVSGGHGGGLLTRDKHIYESALMVGHQKPRTRALLTGGHDAPFGELGLGGNLRMSPLSAVLALDHLGRLDELAAARVHNANILNAAFAEVATPLRSTAEGQNLTFFDFVWVIDVGWDFARVLQALEDVGVPARRVSTRPLSRTLRAVPGALPARSGRYWGDLSRWAKSVLPLPRAEALHDRAISLPSELLYEAGAPFAHLLAGRIATALASVA